MAEKGGVGKTTMSYEFGEYLAKTKNQKVLLIDMDQQLSLTETYNLVGIQENSSVNMFRKSPVEIRHISENLDLIPGSFQIENLDSELLQEDQRVHLLNYWFQDFDKNYHWDQYDYIIFDTHPDFKTVNRAIVMASDVLLMPIEPATYGISAREKLENRLSVFRSNNPSPINRQESLVTAELLFFNNQMELGKRGNILSRQLDDQTKEDPKVLANIPRREIFKHSVAKSTSLSDMALDKRFNAKYSDLIIEVFAGFEKIKVAIDKI